MSSSKKLSIGWYMSSRKIVQLGWEQFCAYAEERGHTLIELDLSKDYETLPNRPHLDLLLLKLTDELVVADADEKAAKVVANGRKLTELYPKAVLVDPIDAQASTIDRERMHDFFDKLNALPDDLQLCCPRGMALQEASDKKKLPADLVFPVMAKTLQASGSHAAHDMAVCWSLDDIDKYAYPLYVQEYVNHGGTIFKIYVLGPDHFVVTRVSLPDFPKTYQKPVEFNSQDWKHELPPELTKEYTGKRKEPSHDILTRVSKCVSDLLHLTLFGFDVIENVDTGRLAVIDVNYFPDYRGVSDVFGKLLTHLTNMYEANAPLQH